MGEPLTYIGDVGKGVDLRKSMGICLHFAPGARLSKVKESSRAREAISKPMKRLMCKAFSFKQSLHLRNVLNLRIFLIFSYGILKLAFRARNLSGAFEKRA